MARSRLIGATSRPRICRSANDSVLQSISTITTYQAYFRLGWLAPLSSAAAAARGGAVLMSLQAYQFQLKADSMAVSGRNFVFFQNLVPATLGFEQQLDHFPDGAGSPRRTGHVVGFLLDFGAGVRGGDGQTDTMHADNVGQVVADIGHLVLLESRVGQNFRQDGNLLDMPLIDVGEFALLGA